MHPLLTEPKNFPIFLPYVELERRFGCVCLATCVKDDSKGRQMFSFDIKFPQKFTKLHLDYAMLTLTTCSKSLELCALLQINSNVYAHTSNQRYRRLDLRELCTLSRHHSRPNHVQKERALKALFSTSKSNLDKANNYRFKSLGFLTPF